MIRAVTKLPNDYMTFRVMQSCRMQFCVCACGHGLHRFYNGICPCWLLRRHYQLRPRHVRC